MLGIRQGRPVHQCFRYQGVRQVLFLVGEAEGHSIVIKYLGTITKEQEHADFPMVGQGQTFKSSSGHYSEFYVSDLRKYGKPNDFDHQAVMT